MSNFFNPPVTRTARKRHRCTYCGEGIAAGEDYMHQKGNWDGSWFDSKFHPECFDDLCENCDGEFTPYDNERPIREGESRE